MNVELNHAVLFDSLSHRVLSSLIKALQLLQPLLIRHPFKKDGFYTCHVPEGLVLHGEVSILYIRGFHTSCRWQ